MEASADEEVRAPSNPTVERDELLDYDEDEDGSLAASTANERRDDSRGSAAALFAPTPYSASSTKRLKEETAPDLGGTHNLFPRYRNGQEGQGSKPSHEEKNCHRDGILTHDKLMKLAEKPNEWNAHRKTLEEGLRKAKSGNFLNSFLASLMTAMEAKVTRFMFGQRAFGPDEYLQYVDQRVNDEPATSQIVSPAECVKIAAKNVLFEKLKLFPNERDLISLLDCLRTEVILELTPHGWLDSLDAKTKVDYVQVLAAMIADADARVAFEYAARGFSMKEDRTLQGTLDWLMPAEEERRNQLALGKKPFSREFVEFGHAATYLRKRERELRKDSNAASTSSAESKAPTSTNRKDKRDRGQGEREQRAVSASKKETKDAATTVKRKQKSGQSERVALGLDVWHTKDEEESRVSQFCRKCQAKTMHNGCNAAAGPCGVCGSSAHIASHCRAPTCKKCFRKEHGSPCRETSTYDGYRVREGATPAQGIYKM